jgi:hypothetical protein
MKPTLNEKFLAYLALFSGLFLSLVAEYYSILGLTAIFAAAVIPVVIMGIALGLGKISATLWLKQNWSIAPWTMRGYLFTAIIVLMLVTSLGIFGFLSKAHSDQNLVSGDVQSKIAIYDEKIKTAKENIESVRRQLKQMDEAVDQVMARSQDEKGADKSNAIRKSQQRDRANLAKDIETNQRLISQLNDEAAPIRAEVRKVEAEVGPIKYIAAFVYGDTDQTVLEKAVTWVIIILIVVFDPMAVILLLASQISFQDFRKRIAEADSPGTLDDEFLIHKTVPAFVADPPVEEKFAEWTDNDFEELAEEALADSAILEKEEYVKWPGGQDSIFCHKCYTELVNAPGIGLFCPNKECDVLDGPLSDHEPEVAVAEPVVKPPEPGHVIRHIGDGEYVHINGQTYHKDSVPTGLLESYVQNEEQKQSGLWTNTISPQEYIDTSKNNKE